MRRKWKIILIVLVIPIVTLIVTFRILESPGRILRHTLNLERLPSSITHLRMGSDVWIDEVRGFYFEIAPTDFPSLLAGRQFQPTDLGSPYEVHTIYVSPPVAFMARWRYRWETEGARCEINTNEEKNRVIAVFSTD